MVYGPTNGGWTALLGAFVVVVVGYAVFGGISALILWLMGAI